MSVSPTSPTSAESSDVRQSEVIYDRACTVQLKLLDGIERDIAEGKLPSPHLEAYEAMVRAEAARTA